MYFDVWGCRGSRSFLPARSAVGNNTSCYSLLDRERLFVLDAGWGLPALGYAMETQRRFRNVKRVDLFVSHAHCDHWEGLKDVGWLWQRGNGLHLHIWGTTEALKAIEEGFEHPSYVPLSILSNGTLGSLAMHPLVENETKDIEGWTARTFALNHHSGEGASLRRLDTLGYRVSGHGGGPTVCYLLDHEPTEATQAIETEVVAGSHMTVYDAHFSTRAEQRYGHGSQEHAASMARKHPGGLILAGHHGPMYSDAALRKNFRHHSKGLPNFRLAVEGDSYTWNPARTAFERLNGDEKGRRRQESAGDALRAAAAQFRGRS